MMADLIRTEAATHKAAAPRHRLSVAGMCRLLGVTRAEVYRPYHQRAASTEEEANVRRQITEVAAQMPSYGYRRVAEEVSRRRATRVNHKRVRRVMREGQIVCRRPKPVRVTTDSRHGLPVYPNLAGELQLDGINQLWVAEIV